jgi:hypothetical protein
MRVIFIGFFLAVSLSAGVQLGRPLHVSPLYNQFGKRIALRTVRQLVFVFDKKASKPLNASLSKKPRGFLARRRALFVVDLSGAPAFAQKFFAIPKMQKLPFSVAVIRNKKTAKQIPHQPGNATVIRLKTGRVVSLKFVAPARVRW